MMGWDWLNGQEQDSTNPGIPDSTPATERPSWIRDGMTATEVNGPNELRLAVDSADQDLLWAIVGNRRDYRIRFDVHVVLVAEDGNAISAWITGRRIGYLTAEDASRLRAGLIRLQREYRRAVALPGLIVGGGTDGPRLDVFCSYDSAAFTND